MHGAAKSSFTVCGGEWRETGAEAAEMTVRDVMEDCLPMAREKAMFHWPGSEGGSSLTDGFSCAVFSIHGWAHGWFPMVCN